MKFKTRKTNEKTNIQSSKVIQGKIANPAKMLKMFTKDLYKHPLQTSIQEYINNAKDAHIMAGKDTSTIEITAPTVANQNVIIKDKGTGLSPKEIEEIFANITVSNKDNSDLFNGGYGIGSKSWFSINNSFIVVSTHKKQKTYYSVNFSENDGITISIDHQESTKESNGLEVILPLANKNQIPDAHKAIIRAIDFWTIKPILTNINKEELTKFYHREEEYSLIDFKNAEGGLQVTLGETSYSIKDLPCYESLCDELFDNFNAVIHLKVGEVGLDNSQEVGPDRESFSLACSDYISKKAKEVHNKIYKKLKADLPKFNNKEDIFRILNNRYIRSTLKDYEKNLKNGITLVFMKEVNYENPVIKNKNPHFININGNITSNFKSISQTKGVSHILINDLNRDIPKKELLTILNEISISESRSRWGYYKNGIYFINKDDYTKEQLNSLKNYFCINYVSEIDYEIPVKEKRKISEGEINLINTSQHPNIKNTKSQQQTIIDNFEILSIKQYNSRNDFNSWHDLCSEVKNKKKHIAIVSESNFNFLVNSGCSVLNLSKVIENRKMRQEKEKTKLINKLKSYDKYLKILSVIELIHSDYSLGYPQNPQILKGLGILFENLPSNNSPIKKELMSYKNLIKNKKSFDKIKLNDNAKEYIKNVSKSNSNVIKYIKDLKKKKPITYHSLFNSDYEELQSSKEIKVLLKLK